MHNLTIAAEISQLLTQISLGDAIMLTVAACSVVILAVWILAYSGPSALSHSPERTNRLPIYLPFLLLALWIVLANAATWLALTIWKDSPDWMQDFAAYVGATAVHLLIIVITPASAWFYFAGRLTGLGLDIRNLERDFSASVVNFIAVLPLVWLALLTVDLVGRFFLGPQFEIKANQGITVLTENPHFGMKLFLIIHLTVIVPFVEEFIFRGLIQSAIRSHLRSPWTAILITSFFFALLHPWQHWLAIFVLSIGLGYSYEKSGSLWRPVFIHMLFNATNVCASQWAAS